jgi:hypothetical protein
MFVADNVSVENAPVSSLALELAKARFCCSSYSDFVMPKLETGISTDLSLMARYGVYVANRLTTMTTKRGLLV